MPTRRSLPPSSSYPTIRRQDDLLDSPETAPVELGPGREQDGGESLLGGQSREQDPRAVEDDELPKK